LDFWSKKFHQKRVLWLRAMAVGATSLEYDTTLAQWSRARDVLSGEDAVKAAGEKYLPRLDSQSEEEYSAYKARASFFGATARTLEEYLDLVFRRAPVVAVGEREGLKLFVSDCDLWGLDLVRYARLVVREVLSVGRAGSLVLWDADAKRPRVSCWRTEDIINWTVERVGQAVVLVEVVLREKGALRVLRMDRTERPDRTNSGECVIEVWERADDQGEWTVKESAVLMRDGGALSFVPFVFHGPRNSRPEPDRLPLADIIAANLDHYRLDADFKHGLHFAALPTAWVSGFDKATPLRIGSSAAWVSDIPGATAGFLEFSGAGLAHIDRAMEKVERRMASLGARMLEMTAGDDEGSGVAAGAAGQLCGLGSIVASLNQSLTRVLQLANWWIEGGDQAVAAADVSFAVNTDLAARGMSGEEITAVVAAWRAGAISRDTLLERLKRGEVLPEGRTVAQERALIHGKSADKSRSDI
jgi:hypothetical protein